MRWIVQIKKKIHLPHLQLNILKNTIITQLSPGLIFHSTLNQRQSRFLQIHLCPLCTLLKSNMNSIISATLRQFLHFFYLKMLVTQWCLTLCDPWTVAHQNTEYRIQEYCHGLPFPSPGNLTNPWIEQWQVGSLPSEPPEWWADSCSMIFPWLRL